MNFARRLAVRFARGRGGDSALHILTRLASVHRLAVLTYHRIATDPGAVRHFAPGLASATVAEFEQQMREVSKHFRVIGLAELLTLPGNATVRGKRPLLMLTFDDAYRDFVDAAWPVIQRYRLPVTMFVATAYPDVGVPYWWDQLAYSIRTTRALELNWESRRLRLQTDRERAIAYRLVHRTLQQMPTASTQQWVDQLVDRLHTRVAPSELLGWHELRQLAQAGLEIGAHSHSHHRLDRLSPDELRSDLSTCLSILAREVGGQPRAFAYPAGFFDQSVARAVEEAGFEVAFTTERGVADPRRLDWYRVPRINVGLASNARLIRLEALALRRRGRQSNEPRI